MSASTRPGSLWLGAAGAAALLLILLFNTQVPPVPATSPAPGGALRVQLDPETGEMVPVTNLDKAELSHQMERRLDRSTAGLTEVHHPDGSVSVDLGGRFQSLSVATIDSSGNVRAGCLTSRQELDAWLAKDPNHQVKE